MATTGRGVLYALLHAGRVGGHPVVGPAGEAHPIEHSLNTRCSFGQAPGLREEAEHFAGGEILVHPHRRRHKPRPQRMLVGRHRLVVDRERYCALPRRKDARQNAKQGRLAGSVGPRHHQRLAAAQRHRKVPKKKQSPKVVADLVDRKPGHVQRPVVRQRFKEH